MLKNQNLYLTALIYRWENHQEFLKIRQFHRQVSLLLSQPWLKNQAEDSVLYTFSMGNLVNFLLLTALTFDKNIPE